MFQCLNFVNVRLAFFSRGKRKKPKFIVTLEGVGSKFEDKYEKEHSKRKRRRKSAHRDDEEQEEINRDVPVMPVYPQFIHGVHQVPGMIPAHLSHPALPLQATQPIHMLPSQATLIAAPNIPVEATVQDGKLRNLIFKHTSCCPIK